MRFPAPRPLVNPGNHFLRHEKEEVLAEILETQFKQVTDPSVPLDIETPGHCQRTQINQL
jgi:hypothetical protein